MHGLSALLDARYEAMAVESHRMAPTRGAILVALTLVAGFGVGWPVALGWAAALLVFEGGGFFLTRAIRLGKASKAQLWTFFWTSNFAVPIWTLYGLILWTGPSDACGFAAVAYWCGQLLYAQNFCTKSPLLAAQAFIPSVIAPLLIPLVWPRFHGFDEGIVMAMLVLCVGHAVVAAFDSMGTGRALETATRDLMAEKLAAEDAERQMAAAKAEADAANAAKSTFLATVSHEIRTPLNGVLGMTQAMSMDKLSAAQRERLEVVRASGEALLTVLNDVLDFSKIEAGKLSLEAIAFDLDETVRGACQAFTALAVEKGLSLRIDTAAAAGTWRGDPLRLRQIVSNLVSNALKFTESGEVAVVATGGDQTLTLTVSDTGEGIAADKLGGLFSAFTQAEASTTRRFGGTGLGLAICRELAGLMGGAIDVASRPGEGTAFTVTLALPRVGDARAAAEPQSAPAAPEQVGVLRVLAAEDNAVNRLVLKTLLAHVGVEPVFAENGQLALEAWEREPWDLILMDVQMPVMDGPTAVRLIREREAALGRARTPIVALSANAMAHQVSEYLAGGMDGHVAKPIEAAKLFAALELASEPAEPGARSNAA